MTATVVPGLFCTVCGIEGSGKSSIVRRLEQFVRKTLQQPVLHTREPGGSPGAEEIRRLLVSGEPDRWGPMTELLLHTAARVDHVARVIRPALAQGTWVLCDRFYDSSRAYQGYGHGLGVDVVDRIQAEALGAFAPDLTLILDASVEVGLKRAAARRGGEDRYERMDREFHERVRQGFLEIAAREPQRCIVIDADRGPDVVWSEALAALGGYLVRRDRGRPL